MGSRCLLVMRVSGCSRLPVPPARITPFILGTSLGAYCLGVGAHDDLDLGTGAIGLHDGAEAESPLHRLGPVPVAGVVADPGAGDIRPSRSSHLHDLGPRALETGRHPRRPP